MTAKPAQKPATSRQSDKPWVAGIRAALDEDKERKAKTLPRSPTAFLTAGAAPKSDGQASKPASPSEGPTAPLFDEKHWDEVFKARHEEIAAYLKANQKPLPPRPKTSAEILDDIANAIARKGYTGALDRHLAKVEKDYEQKDRDERAAMDKKHRAEGMNR